MSEHTLFSTIPRILYTARINEMLNSDYQTRISFIASLQNIILDILTGDQTSITNMLFYRGAIIAFKVYLSVACNFLIRLVRPIQSQWDNS